MTAVVRSAVLGSAKLDAYPAEVTASIAPGPDGFIVTGCPAIDVPGLRDRIRAAVFNSGLEWPPGAVVIAVSTAAPSVLEPCCLDLAITVAILVSSGQCPEPPESAVLLAGLGLDGSLRRVQAADVLAMAASLLVAGACQVISHAFEMRNVSCLEGVTAVGCLNLGRAVRWIGAAEATVNAEVPDAADR